MIMDELNTQALAQPIVSNMFGLDRANTFLVSSLVKHLVKEGVIDLDKYLKDNKETEEIIKKNILKLEVSDDLSSEELQRNAEFVGNIFNMHRKDFAEPE